MSGEGIRYAVFTKPWKMPLPELGKFVKDMGFDGIELPVRPEYQVEPESVAKGLPEAAKILADCGVKIESIAGPTDEATIEACGKAGVPIIRICESISKEENYLDAEDSLQMKYDNLVPILDRYGVTLGIQNHCNRFVPNAMCLKSLIGGYNSKHVAAVWDAAHNALNGEDLDLAIDIIYPQICMVNLKNGYWKRQTGPEAEVAKWKVYWTSGRQGLASWPLVAQELKKRDWFGVLCLTAEYSDHDSVDRLIKEDLALAKSLFE